MGKIGILIKYTTIPSYQSKQKQLSLPYINTQSFQTWYNFAITILCHWHTIPYINESF